MKLLNLLSLAASALAVAIENDKRDSAIAVKLEEASSTGVKATITNSGASAIKVLKSGSILDSSLVEKTEIFQASKSYIDVEESLFLIYGTSEQG